MSTQTGQSCLLESVSGDEAARILLSHFRAAGFVAGALRSGARRGASSQAPCVQTPALARPRSACASRIHSGHPATAASERLSQSVIPDRATERPSGRGIDLLRDLAGRFAEFPYENISKIIKAGSAASLADAMRLPAEVVTDHFERNFGGTCFSLTFLFERVLKSLGFDCYKVMADMNSGPNVHCLVVVREGGAKYIVDPGYALYEVIDLNGGRVACPHATVEVCASGADTYGLWTEDASGRKWRYRFQDSPVEDRAFQEHWLASFVKPTLHNICLTRMTPRGHIYLRKDFFKFTSPTSVEKRRIRNGRERLVEEEFGIAAEWVDLAQNLLDRDRKAASGVEVGAQSSPNGRTPAQKGDR